MEVKENNLIPSCVIDRSFISSKGNEVCENSLSKQSTISKDCKELTQEMYVNLKSNDLLSFSYSKSNSVNTIREEHEKDFDIDLDERIKLMKKINEIKDKKSYNTKLISNPNKRINNLMDEYIKFKNEIDQHLDLSSSLISKSSITPQIPKMQSESKHESIYHASFDIKSEEKSTLVSDTGSSLKDFNKTEVNWVNIPSKKQTLISNSFSSIKLDYPELENKSSLSSQYDTKNFQNMKINSCAPNIYPSDRAHSYYQNLSQDANPNIISQYNNSNLGPICYPNMNTNSYINNSFGNGSTKSYYYDPFYSQYGYSNTSQQNWIMPKQQTQLINNVSQTQLSTQNRSVLKEQSPSISLTDMKSNRSTIEESISKTPKNDSNLIQSNHKSKKYVEPKISFEVNLMAVSIIINILNISYWLKKIRELQL